jgi:type II secretory pathway pseudopilin PulG
MARVSRTAANRRFRRTEGFSLIEVMIATALLSVGVLSLVGVMALAVRTAASSSPMLIAREKAREAIESVHSARDTGELAWSRVQNVSDGGDFLDGMQDLRVPGPDGLINTADDGDIEVLHAPGADGLLDTDDDTVTPLAPDLFQREVAITPLTFDGSAAINPDLRRIVVTVRYRVTGSWRTYTLTTYVSSYS